MKSKKICFVMLTNIYLSPYLEKYTSIIDCEFDIIYWNRHNVKEKTGAKNHYEFKYILDEGKGNISKLLGYLKFRAYARKILQINHYDGIIVLTTSAGILLNDVLIKDYYNKYIIDIRDYTFENNFLFFAIEKKLIEYSFFTVISSRGFLRFLPVNNKYVITHNNLNIEEVQIQRFKTKRKIGDPIVISYIGLIRFHDQNKRLIDIFGGDERFLLRFIGKDAFALQDYCKEKMINNVILIDWFPPEMTLDYYYETDLISNLYGNQTPLLDYALSNKLYYAARLNIPILVCSNTFMAEISTKYGFGYIFSLDNENEKDNLFNYFKNISWEKFEDGCNKFIECVDVDNLIFNKKVQAFIEQIDV